MSALDSGAKSFFSTLKEVGTDKAISEALIGGGVGIGGNMAYNVATGDSGGYTGAALLGGAAGGLGRAGLKHFNLETQASNLFSTMKTGSVGAMTQAQKTMGTKSNKPAGQIYRKGNNESNIQGYRNQEAMKLRQARKLNQEGYPTQAKELFSEADALAVRRKELLGIQESQKGRMGRNPEVTQKRVDAEKVRSESLGRVQEMGKSDVPLLGYNPKEPEAIQLPHGTVERDPRNKRFSENIRNRDQVPNSFGVSDITPPEPKVNSSYKPQNYMGANTGNFSGEISKPIPGTNYKSSSSHASNMPGYSINQSKTSRDYNSSNSMSSFSGKINGTNGNFFEDVPTVPEKIISKGNKKKNRRRNK